MNKKYILQKDIVHPVVNAVAGAVFEKWNDHDNKSNVYINGLICLHPSYVENNPEWFLPENSPMELAWDVLVKENPMLKDDWLSKGIFERGWNDATKESKLCR